MSDPKILLTLIQALIVIAWVLVLAVGLCLFLHGFSGEPTRFKSKLLSVVFTGSQSGLVFIVLVSLILMAAAYKLNILRSEVLLQSRTPIENLKGANKDSQNKVFSIQELISEKLRRSASKSDAKHE
jgi:hypothetical protein